MSDNTQPQGETEAEYYERVKSVPGFFSDSAESAHAVVTKAKRLLHEAEQHFERSTLAPDPHPEGSAPVEAPEPVAEPEVPVEPEVQATPIVPEPTLEPTTSKPTSKKS